MHPANPGARLHRQRIFMVALIDHPATRRKHCRHIKPSIDSSMNGSGNVWDNAAIESFFRRSRANGRKAKSTELETRRAPMCLITSGDL